MESVNADYTKMVIHSLYISKEMALRLVEGEYINNYGYGVHYLESQPDVHCAYVWDLVNDHLHALQNTIVTPEDDLAEQCMLLYDNGARLIYLNNL